MGIQHGTFGSQSDAHALCHSRYKKVVRNPIVLDDERIFPNVQTSLPIPFLPPITWSFHAKNLHIDGAVKIGIPFILGGLGKDGPKK